jgi:thiamine-phosphate pyrophosphorylase
MAERCLLCYITDRSAFSGDECARRERLLQKIAEAAACGVDYIQLREKDLRARDLELLAAQAVDAIRSRGKSSTHRPISILLINSRTDVALATLADGVHLPANDILPNEVRLAWSKAASHSNGERDAVIGVSCHSVEEVARAAAMGATFALLAPVFEKKDPPRAKPIGLESLSRASRANIPVLALGGVTLANAPLCLRAGASGIAAIRLFQENDIAAVVRAMRG